MLITFFVFVKFKLKFVRNKHQMCNISAYDLYTLLKPLGKKQKTKKQNKKKKKKKKHKNRPGASKIDLTTTPGIFTIDRFKAVVLVLFVLCRSLWLLVMELFLFCPVYCLIVFGMSSQQTHNVATTSLQRSCNVVTLQRRCNDVVCLLDYHLLRGRRSCLLCFSLVCILCAVRLFVQFSS